MVKDNQQGLSVYITVYSVLFVVVGGFHSNNASTYQTISRLQNSLFGFLVAIWAIFISVLFHLENLSNFYLYVLIFSASSVLSSSSGGMVYLWKVPCLGSSRNECLLPWSSYLEEGGWGSGTTEQHSMRDGDWGRKGFDEASPTADTISKLLLPSR